jgi:hypothetical protein
MISIIRDRCRQTRSLALRLGSQQVYDWLVTDGYFPEPYVLPPCFVVKKHAKFGKPYFRHTASKFKPKLTEYQQVHFPRTNYTDRTFGIIDPEIHSDIAFTIAENWEALMEVLFHKDNKVATYSFPVPLNAKQPGSLGTLRVGRMIYEFIEMAENDLAAVAFRFKFLVRTDVKNFYPSVYTHSIPWAIHGKKFIRKASERHNFLRFGNRLDKLFQNANDGCTNGLPIGPVVSDLMGEVVLSGVDRFLSKQIDPDILVVRFKDDYRILSKTKEKGISAVKSLQSALRNL